MLKSGTLVVSKTRMLPVLQPWIHGIYVGRIIEPGDDPEQWNGTNSERFYCDLKGWAKVQYGWGNSYDSWENLVEITPEQAALSPIEKVFIFIGEEAVETWLSHSSPEEVTRLRALLSRHNQPEEEKR